MVALTSGRTGGTVACVVTNYLAVAADLELLVIHPWLIRPLSHTLRVRGATIASPEHSAASRPHASGSVVATSRHAPTQDRGGNGLWEFRLRLGPNTTVELRFDIVRAYLKLDEFSPDPNRGFAVPAAVLSGWSEDPSAPAGGAAGSARRHARVYSEQLSILVPHPDFSMPFNVIALTSTLLAGSFGIWVQFATRPLVDTPPNAQGRVGT
jgi:phosphatidylinositol glycan class T